jgi:hypothetical protein
VARFVHQLAGQQFGKLTAVRRENGRWLCDCECGGTKSVEAYNLTRGLVQSCGCLTLTHGATRRGRRTRLYGVWSMMRQRCENPHSHDFGRYGGRGITICERWLDFDAFREDMGDPGPGATIERIDNDGPYAPDNCRWASRKEQARNTSRSLRLTVGGITRTAAEWAELSGDPRLTATRISTRVGKGWSAERAVTEPVRTLTRKDSP